MEKKDYFTMSQLLKVLNITEGTIRNYEKKGLITTDKQSFNHYRRFDYRDLNRIATVRKYRDCDVPLNDIKALLNSESAENSQRILLKHQQALQEEVSRLTKLIEKMDADIDRIEHVTKHLNTFSFTKRPSFVFYSLDDIIGDKRIVSEDLFVEYASLIDKKQFYHTIKPVFGCVNMGEVSEHESGKAYQECSCLYTVIKVEPFHTGVMSFSNVLENSRKYIQEHHYSVVDDILGIKLLTLQDEGKPVDYYEIYMPVVHGDSDFA